MIIEGLTPQMGPVRLNLSRLVVKDCYGNIVGFFHVGPDGKSITCNMIGDDKFESTLAEFGIQSTTVVDHLEA